MSFNVYFYFICRFACTCVCVLYAWSALRGQKKVLNPLQLSHRVGSGNPTQALCKSWQELFAVVPPLLLEVLFLFLCDHGSI